MSGKAESKKISRPKVSFRQSERDEEETVKRSKERATEQSEGHDAPKIRSIVTLHTLVKIVNPEEATATASDKRAYLSEREADGSTRAICGDTASENARDTSEVVKDVARTTEMCQTSDVKEKRDVSQLGKTRRGNIVENYTNLQRKGKEKEDRWKGAAKLQPVPIPRVAKLGKPPTKTEAPEANSATLLRLVQSSHMPYYKMLAKNKLFPVKKANVKNRRVKDESLELRHVVSPRGEFKPSSTIQQEYPGQSLEHPKCNSIVCVADKLKKLKRQKIGADISHLSPLEKTILNGKISMALDFTLDEAIYKDLVDLSVDEEMFPRAGTRTKDPEARQKDIVPKLSDFFIPEAMKEQCEAVHVKLRSPKIHENWNAFRISAKLLEWRYNLDELDEVAQLLQ